MSADGELEVFKQHRQGQDKLVYFLLAAAGASIAFALNQTSGLSLAFSQIPLGIAVALWGASFVAGCAYLERISELLNLNKELLRVRAGTHEALTHALEIPVAADVILERIRTKNTTAARISRWQYRFLILGAVAYIGWHISEMALRV